MLRNTMIATGLALAMMSGTALAQSAPQEVTFTLTATIPTPGLSVEKRDGQLDQVSTDQLTKNGNPSFDDPIKLTVSHPTAGVQVKLGRDFQLTHSADSDNILAMTAEFDGSALSTDTPTTVASVSEADASGGKSVDIAIKVTNDAAPAAAGNYTGTLSLVFEELATSST